MFWRRYLVPTLALVILVVTALSPVYADAGRASQLPTLSEPAPYRGRLLPTEGAMQDGPTVVPILSDFDALSQEIGQMHDLHMFLVGDDGFVHFDAVAAQTASFSAESIRLASEMMALSNDLIHVGKTDKSRTIESLPVDTSPYPILEQYFVQASIHLDEMVLTGAVDTTELQQPQFGWGTTTAYWYCGNWWQPKPTRAANWISHSSSNPARTLSSWGYHSTPDSAGGGCVKNGTKCPQNSEIECPLNINENVRSGWKKSEGWRTTA